jgi:hypothetical protein
VELPTCILVLPLSHGRHFCIEDQDKPTPENFMPELSFLREIKNLCHRDLFKSGGMARALLKVFSHS